MASHFAKPHYFLLFPFPYAARRWQPLFKVLALELNLRAKGSESVEIRLSCSQHFFKVSIGTLVRSDAGFLARSTLPLDGGSVTGIRHPGQPLAFITLCQLWRKLKPWPFLGIKTYLNVSNLLYNSPLTLTRENYNKLNPNSVQFSLEGCFVLNHKKLL